MKNNEPKPKNKICIAPMIIRVKEEDMPYIFFTSDWHIQHKNILNFTQRGIKYKDVDDMFNGIMFNMNVIYDSIPDEHKHQAMLFHCGDLLFGSRSKCQEFYKEIQDNIEWPKVYCVMGNHDVNNIMRQHEVIPAYNPAWDRTECNPNWMWNNMFIVEVYRESKCIATVSVSHFPMEEYHGSLNIHGHLHTRPEQYVKEDFSYLNMKRWAEAEYHYDAGVDNNDYMPISLYEIMQKLNPLNNKEV